MLKKLNTYIALLLAAITLICFWPVGQLGFIGYDDFDYVFHNQHVQAGLSVDGITWAFTTFWAQNWHPLTWMSHMLDCDLFGVNAQASHWINLGFHVANSVLVFLWLQEITGKRWRSFLVAALFAIHPLHIQSVAWISERKDVLSGFFCLATLMAYTRYCRNRTKNRYLMVTVFFTLGLLAKPMLVTLPAVLLLLDFWPLARNPCPPECFWKNLVWLRRWRVLLVEKIPLFILAAGSSIVTIYAQKAGGAVTSLEKLGGLERLQNALVSYGRYLEKLFWPVDLAIFYPLPAHSPPLLSVLGASLLLIMLFGVGLWQWRERPYFLAGWLWFFIMLLPVIGLIQVGTQAMADRYSYLPAIGLFILIVWSVAELKRTWPQTPKIAGIGLGLALLIACARDTRYQLHFWQDNITLFKRVIAVAPEENAQGYYYLGLSYFDAGDLAQATNALEHSLKLLPGFDMARGQLGKVLLLQKNYSAAEPHLQAVSQAHPEDIAMHISLGLCLAGEKKYLAAWSEYQTARQLKPDNANIAQLVADIAPKVDAAQQLAALSEIVKIKPTAETYKKMIQIQSSFDDYQGCVQSYREILALDPDEIEALNNLAWLLATCRNNNVRNGPQAVTLAQHACELTKSEKTVFLGTLGAAYAEAGEFDEAIITAQRACDVASKNGETNLLESNQRLLALYRNHEAYHE